MKTKQDFPSINERPPEGVKEDGSKVRVLVVDDSMFVAKQLGQILTSEGYEVVAPPGLAAGGGAIMRSCTYTRQTGHGPAVPLMPAHGRWPQVLTRPHKGWQGAPKVFLD